MAVQVPGDGGAVEPRHQRVARRRDPHPEVGAGSRHHHPFVGRGVMPMIMYDARPFIPVDRVAKDWFHLSTDRFLRKKSDGLIPLPVVHLEEGRKGHKCVVLQDLADFLEKKAAEAREEMRKPVA